MSAFDPLFENRIAVIDAATAGAATVDELTTPSVGPTAYDRIEYPYCQILPEATDDQGGNEWAHTLRINCYFEREREYEYTTLLATVLDAATAALDAIADIECVVSYRPQLIEDFAGELDNTLLLLISVQLRVTTVVDLGA